MSTVRVYADFNDRTTEGACTNLHLGSSRLEEANLAEHGLKVGAQVILYQDENDFEVRAELAYRFIEELGRMALIARPDWSTFRQLSGGPKIAER